MNKLLDAQEFGNSKNESESTTLARSIPLDTYHYSAKTIARDTLHFIIFVP
jgi:hypothetical protein